MSELIVPKEAKVVQGRIEDPDRLARVHGWTIPGWAGGSRWWWWAPPSCWNWWRLRGAAADWRLAAANVGRGLLSSIDIS